ncbi:hypothetical protein JO972_09555 [Verrucomicrobiaceae bacterium 5K15]|uniref:Uncharacterized protein n=1 Tax=Oceaniferula flava TaxID=2800421 RepID=A0AAE2SF60_9BACT|nr:TonB-dependent receptor [Oceaniferula flavus]MBK1855201.1 hypothetical protein [Oceaniferula flavus]MBM1136507.1 hypothetical protein [Oceaniferula flavus]
MKLTRLLLALTPAATFAGESMTSAQPAATASPWTFTLDAGYLHQQDSDLDEGGSFSVDRTNFALGVQRNMGPARSIGLSLDYGHHDYQFDGIPALWDEVDSFTLGVPIRWALDRDWSLFALPSVRASYEHGAEVSDSVTGGLLAGASYRVSDRLYIGPGLGISSELEDDLNVFPILLIKWQISDTLELKTGRGLGASQGPGLVLNWQAAEKWQLSLGTRYEKLRFRLNDRGYAPDGVGEETGIPVYLGATYQFSDSSQLSLYAGMKFGSSLEVENDNGHTIYDSDQDAAPFFGLSWNSKF